MTTYATPVTLSDFTTLIQGITWTTDCEQQAAKIQDIQNRLEAIRLGWQNLFPVYLHVVSDDSPTLADWQTAWVDQGRTLPISGNVRGLWETSDSSLSAKYLFINNDMVPMLATWWNGSAQYFVTTPGMYTNTTTLSTADTQLINSPITLDRDAWMEMHHAEARNETTTTVQYRLGSDAGSSTRQVLFPNGAASAPNIQYFIIRPDVKTTVAQAAAMTVQFRTISGTGTVLFTNNGVTRKIETGLYPYFLGEGNVLYMKATYLL